MGGFPAAGHARRRPRSGTFVLLAGLSAVLAIGLVTAVVTAQRSGAPAPANLSGASPAAPPAPAAVVHLVTYELTGTGSALAITYVGRQGAGIEQVAEAALPWSVSVRNTSTAGSDQYFTLTARDAGTGGLGCRILVDGTTVSESATGPQGVVRCSKALR
ncbi:hypothetical protein FG385_26975 [Amycolatopsis alkalitolerans]|uniref:MmpS family membrane protein n=2 Tax=Amycolatopsis alkalitolerans TaxID=2547244 RepID=A0A5C4LTH3_9PSEU|nr:hypothetical protein FG385_26975 [Amycolatopsis alkalitolerans]